MTGVQTCALPICLPAREIAAEDPLADDRHRLCRHALVVPAERAEPTRQRGVGDDRHEVRPVAEARLELVGRQEARPGVRRLGPEDAVELAVELIQQKKLTKFQAEEISRGNGASLTLGNYVLLDMIGQGGMGQVYKAQHTRMDRLVAIKVLPPSMIDNSEAIARFEQIGRAHV